MKINSVLSFALAAMVAICAIPAFGQSNDGQGNVVPPPTGTWLFGWGIDGTLTFETNGVPSYDTSSEARTFNSATVWNMQVTFNNGIASVIATTTTDNGLNWSYSGSMGTLNVLDSLYLLVSASTTNDEGMTISGININNGVPISGTLTADQNQHSDGMMIHNSGGITSLDYILTVDTPNPVHLADQDSLGNPAVMSEIMAPGPVPEPSTVSFGILGSVAVILLRRFKK